MAKTDVVEEEAPAVEGRSDADDQHRRFSIPSSFGEMVREFLDRARSGGRDADGGNEGRVGRWVASGG